MKNKFTFTDEFGVKNYLRFVERHYLNNNLAIEAVDYDTGKPYCMVSVNLDELHDPSLFCYDMNNNGLALYYALIKAGLMENTGAIKVSGYCLYPVCRWIGNYYR